MEVEGLNGFGRGASSVIEGLEGASCSSTGNPIPSTQTDIAQFPGKPIESTGTRTSIPQPGTRRNEAPALPLDVSNPHQNPTSVRG